MKEKDRKKAIEELNKEFPGFEKEFQDEIKDYDMRSQYKTIFDKNDDFFKHLKKKYPDNELMKGIFPKVDDDSVAKILEAKEKDTVIIDNSSDYGEVKRTDFSKNDILQLEKFNSYDLLVKSVYNKVVLRSGLIFQADKREMPLIKKIIEHDKFRNIKIDDKLVNLLIHTDNTIYKRNLFYPAFFIDADFKFDDRFIVKGMMVFQCKSIKQNKRISDVKFDGVVDDDTRIHFEFIDKLKNDMTCFGVSFNDVINDMLGYAKAYILPEYLEEKEVITNLLYNVLKTLCTVIDLIEGNKDELEIKYIVPTHSQSEKRIVKGKSPITTTVIIKPKKELLAYTEEFEREHRKMKYSHRFIVRGFWRHLKSEYYKERQGKKIWIRPFIKGKGILIKKDVLFTDGDVDKKG